MEIEKVTCPHCNHVHENWQDFINFEVTEDDFELDCNNCKKWFRVFMDARPRFSTQLLDEE